MWHEETKREFVDETNERMLGEFKKWGCAFQASSDDRSGFIKEGGKRLMSQFVLSRLASWLIYTTTENTHPAAATAADSPEPYPGCRWHPNPLSARRSPVWLAYPVPQSTTHAGSRPAISPWVSVVEERFDLTGIAGCVGWMIWQAVHRRNPSPQQSAVFHFRTRLRVEAGRGKMAEAGQRDAGRVAQLSIIRTVDKHRFQFEFIIWCSYVKYDRKQ